MHERENDKLQHEQRNLKSEISELKNQIDILRRDSMQRIDVKHIEKERKADQNRVVDVEMKLDRKEK